MNIGAKIRALRKEKRVTQEELAEYLHISSQAVSKWETGASAPDIDMLPKLAIYFGTSLDNLLDFDQSKLDAAIEQILIESGRGGKDPARSEAYLRKALEKYPNNDLLLTCILEDMQEQNGDGSRSAEIIEIGERILNCTKDDANRIDVYRAMAETYHQMGEQAMAELYLKRSPAYTSCTTRSPRRSSPARIASKTSNAPRTSASTSSRACCGCAVWKRTMQARRRSTRRRTPCSTFSSVIRSIKRSRRSWKRCGTTAVS
ncbi:MAG: helix-turn-helix domain-containing protein [Clostridia bacterium]|nr:helix-turn-helix domain-containing protein [Clostridia bacterium]